MKNSQLKVQEKERYSTVGKKAQIVTEYVLTFFVVLGVFITMAVYIQRTLQGRIRDAQMYAFSSVNAAYLNGSLKTVQYEPYYANAISYADRSLYEEKKLLKGGSTGIFRHFFNTTTRVDTQSEQLPP